MRGGISPHLVGVASELKAAALMTENGYEVYFPMASQSRCDFVAIKGDEVLRVQVKTITVVKIGKQFYQQSRLKPRCSKTSMYTRSQVDTYIFVGNSGMYNVPHNIIEGLTSVNFGNINGSINSPRKGAIDFSQYKVN